MSKLRGTVVAILAGGVLACAALAMAQAIKQAPPASEPYRPLRRDAAIIQPNDARQAGVTVVRMINTAEAKFKGQHGRYATWDELFRSGAIAEEQKRWPQAEGMNLSAGPEVVKGWTLAMIVSTDGQGYELSLRSLQDKCQLSFFSDPRGLIYEGRIIGCAAEMMPVHR